nr:hypothetical protein [uncultured Niameybacter sp.]
MKKQEIKGLSSGEALKRLKTAPTIVVIGPSTSGKSTMVYALVNHRIIGFIKVGIGDKSQTTLIPANFLFDKRIEKNEHFSIKIQIKDFAAKDVHIEILEQLSILFSANGCCAEDTIESIDKEWFSKILEPEDASYHLGMLANEICIDKFKDSIKSILEDIENSVPSFDEQVKAKKKELSQHKVKISEIRRMVFEALWEKLDGSILKDYYDWLNSIGAVITNNLKVLIGMRNKLNSICEYSVEKDDDFPYGGDILQILFNPYEPYSLVISNITLACKPREELLEMADENIPLRFCLRDTMGLTQIGMDNNSIKDALDIALNCSPDSILLLMNLEERDDVISASCEAIAEKLSKAEKLDVPVNVFFTKADKIIENLINKADKDTVKLKQQDYDDNIMQVIASMEASIKGYIKKLPQDNISWLSLRYREKDIDPIQIALDKLESDKLEKFQPEGLYKSIYSIVDNTQRRILPQGMVSPLFVTAIDCDKPAVEIKIDGGLIENVFSNIKQTLTEDKAIVNGYTITTPYTIHGRSVVNYYHNLKNGQGYTTRARVYGNFSINMKALLNKVLCNNIPDFLSLYESQVVSTIIDNIPETEIDKMIQVFDRSKEICEFAYADINPAILNVVPDKVRKSQMLHLIFRHYFASSEKYYMVMNKVAFNLSYENDTIKYIIDSIYQRPIGYDQTIREMQEAFRSIFGSAQFASIIADEIGKSMTDIVNKMFIVI